MGLAEHFLETDPVVMYESEAWVVAIPSDTWQATLDGIWVHVRRAKIPDYGWKIHVSSTLEDAASVLSIVSEIAFDFGCAFKYLCNGNSFRTLHFKNASRLQSGKFIALYPHSEAITAQLLEKLYNALKLYSGLDILTDRAYKDSTNVYYRWGAFNNSGRINAKGEPEELVPNGLGEMVPDIRLPRFSLPEGIFDPFIEDFSDTSRYLPPKSVSLNQFKIDSVLRFTNAGGRYKGICQLSGAEVVIKEARPNTGFVGEESAIPRLHREISVLEKIGSSVKGLAPSVVKKFTAEGHDYVAIEYVPGTPLSEWIARENPLYSYLYRSPTHTQEYFSRATTIIRNIWINLKKLHDLGLAYGDLSLGNVIIDELDHPRFIDFESCTSVDDTVLGLRTPDFCLRHQNGDLPAKDRDIYAFHCIAIALVLRLTTLAEISDHVLKAVTAELANVLSDIPSWWPDACNFLTESSRRYSACKVPDFVAPSLDTPISRARLREMISSAALGLGLITRS
jgi:serine/threonine protein kinase